MSNHIDTFGWRQPRIEADGELVYVHTYQARFHLKKRDIENVDAWIHEFVELGFCDLIGDEARITTYHLLDGKLYVAKPRVSHFLTSCFTESGLCGHDVDGDSFIKSIRIPPKVEC